ncbi:hypothetical protein IQ07DRAFT_513277 [Pyrenochaeta sp. DS3sAY3a]|nr:hypothetical protein IQ07DRAFT_513277 [Pyrenochaeta sp. DS3sAY3a]
MPSQTQTVDIVMVDPEAEHPRIDEAIEAIHASVLDEHRREFNHQTHASLLLNELRALSAGNGTAAGLRLVPCCQKLAIFVRNFAPYFDILSTCTQIRPEWIGWFWGTVRLVFKIGSNYVTFLEKIVDMFEVIAHILPPYQQIFETIQHAGVDAQLPSEDARLAALLSHVYADLVQLFLDLYRTFCRGAQGSGLRHLSLDSTQSALWRPLDSRFARLEMRLSQHRRWLQKETESQIQNYAEITEHRNNYVSFLNHQQELNGSANGELEEQRLAKRLRRVDKIKRWLSNSSSSVEDCDSGSQYQSSNPSPWFLQDPAYRRWKGGRFDRSQANDEHVLESNWQHRVLFVQAKLGFGKTNISNTVIQDLVAEAENLEIEDQPLSTAFFHFERTRPESGQLEDAFCSLATQLLQTHRHDHATLDAICLLLRKTSFREKATSEEALDVLSLLLRQHPTFLVIDGIDESNDVETFLTSLAGVCRRSDTRVVLFSRPNIRIPLEYQKWASDAPHILALTNEHNKTAIEQYVAQDLNRLADQGFFGISMDRALIPQVALTANGEFLWATTLLRFLHSPSLSSEERHAVLENIHTLQGLESLYRNMLGALERRPEYEKRIIVDVFRWLSFPINRLCTWALRAALSTYDSSLTGESYPTDVIEALPELTFGLVHVKNDTVSFTHSSIREYLQASLSRDSEFSLYDENSVHAHLAARCLSYLAHDVPKRPLGGLQPPSPPIIPTIPSSSGASQRTSRSGDSGYKSISSSDGDHHPAMPAIHSHPTNTSTSSLRTIPFDTQLPFLRYAALCWPIHLSRALLPSGQPTPPSYLPALSAFLRSRLAVAAWVEASFRYKFPPTLTRLIAPLALLKAEIPPATYEGKELRGVLGEMRELSEALVQVKREWATSLRENPSLIWQMEVASGEEYWPVWGNIVGE